MSAARATQASNPLMDMHRISRILLAGVLLAGLAAPARGAAQTPTTPPRPLPAPPGATPPPVAGARTLSLDEALTLAEGNSDAIVIAQAGVMRTHGQHLQAASQRLPQLTGSAGYSRALASQFSSLSGGSDTTTSSGPQNCGKFSPHPGLPADQRLDSLEHAVDCASNSSPFSSLGSLPFGRANTWSLGLNLSQNLFAGGRIAAQVNAASAAQRRAELALASARAQLVLDVAQAYYDAALSDRLLQIGEATLAQAEETLRQTRLARQVGNQPEFELLRAQVTRDNQLPVVILRSSNRELAYTRLRLLLDLPADAPLALSTPLNDAAPVAVDRFASNPGQPGDTSTVNRAAVRQAQEVVAAQEAQVRVARAQRFPTVSLVSSYGKVGYPNGAFPSWSDFSTNWTVGAQLSVPLFTGGRIRGDQMVAEAGVIEARATLEATKQLAQLDARIAQQQLVSARASWQASTGTVEQAERAYHIAEIRYREGLSTQTELSESRILLQQAEANRAQAARDLQIAQLRMNLLADLPLSSVQAAAASQQQFQSSSGTTTTTTTQPVQPQATQGAAFSGTGGVQ
jgi:outer membrane protein TolC